MSFLYGQGGPDHERRNHQHEYILRLPVIPAELELAQVAVQVLYGKLVKAANDARFRRPQYPSIVQVWTSPRTHSFALWFTISCFCTLPGIRSYKRLSSVQISGASIEMLSLILSITLKRLTAGTCHVFALPSRDTHSDHGLFIILRPFAALVVFAADVCLVNLYGSSQGLLVVGSIGKSHGFADAAIQEPSGLVRYLEIPLHLQSAHTLFRVHHERHAQEPFLKIQVSIVENRSFGRGELGLATPADVQDTCGDLLGLVLPGFQI